MSPTQACRVPFWLDILVIDKFEQECLLDLKHSRQPAIHVNSTSLPSSYIRMWHSRSLALGPGRLIISTTCMIFATTEETRETGKPAISFLGLAVHLHCRTLQYIWSYLDLQCWCRWPVWVGFGGGWVVDWLSAQLCPALLFPISSYSTTVIIIYRCLYRDFEVVSRLGIIPV